MINKSMKKKKKEEKKLNPYGRSDICLEVSTQKKKKKEKKSMHGEKEEFFIGPFY